MTITSTIFKPSEHSLNDNRRLRIKNGKLWLEDKSVREKAKKDNRIYSFFTRYQYSQSAILSKMNTLYRQAETSKKLTLKLIDNYRCLIKRAQEQNLAYENMWCVFRFFKAKSHISLSIHWTTIKATVASFRIIPPTPPANSGTPPVGDDRLAKDQPPGTDSIDKLLWDDDVKMDQNLESSKILENLGIYLPIDFLAKFTPSFLIEAEKNIPSVTLELFRALGFSTVADFEAANIKSVSQFKRYFFSANRRTFVHKLKELPYINLLPSNI